MFTEGVAARQLGCALANTRSLSVSALGTVCHLLEAERGNPRIYASSSLLATLIIFHLLSPLFINRVFFRDRLPSHPLRGAIPLPPSPFTSSESCIAPAPARIKHDRDDGSSRGW